MKKLLISDLDDTLYSWIDFFIPAFYAMLDEVSKITSIDKIILLKEYKERHQFYGSVEYPFVTLTLPSVLNKYKNTSVDEIKAKLGEAFHRFNSVRKRELKLYPNVYNTLEKLSNNGIKIVGYTESSQENGFYRLKKLDIDKFFDNVYTYPSTYESVYPSDPKIKLVKSKKPNKEVLINICKNENCRTSDAVYVGDSLTKDMYMAVTAGVTSVWVNYPKTNNNYYHQLVEISSWTTNDFEQDQYLKKIWNDKKMQPDYTITDFKALLEIFCEQDIE